LSNDAFDASTGVDKSKRESVVNLTGSRNGVLAAAKLFLALGAWLLATAVGGAGNGAAGAMLAVAVACGYVYQGPPFRFSYRGLGEPLCFVAFGPLATPAFYLALSAATSSSSTGSISAAAAGGAGATGTVAAWASALAAVPASVWAASVLVGATTTAILFCSHFHQIEGDAAAGKRSPLVRLGAARAARVLRGALAGTYAVALALTAAGALPLPALLATAASLPAARALLAFADANHADAAAIAPLKRYAVKWHIAFGLALVAGLALGRRVPLLPSL
jgi:1,4-dihydroxy-2-naphthoate octaprenyltransferase